MMRVSCAWHNRHHDGILGMWTQANAASPASRWPDPSAATEHLGLAWRLGQRRAPILHHQLIS